MFERKMFIKDLYNLKEIYSSFREIEFLHTKDFIIHMEKGYLFENQIFTVHVETTEDVVSLVSLLMTTEISKIATKEEFEKINIHTDEGDEIVDSDKASKMSKLDKLLKMRKISIDDDD